MRIVSTAEMKEIEKSANERGISYYDMMERAGRGTAEYIKANTKNFETKLCLVVAGTGNNGGDGYAAARYLKEMGGIPMIMMASGPPKTPDAIKNFELAKDMGIEILLYDSKVSASVIYGCDVIADCVFGTGFHGELRENIKSLFETINDSDAEKFAVDIPSGVSDSGVPSEGAIKADHTIAIQYMKNAHISAPEQCGRIKVLDIGIGTENAQSQTE